MKNITMVEFRNQLNKFYDKFQLYDETNVEIDYKDPTKLSKELKKYQEAYDLSFKRYLEKNYTITNKKEITSFIEKNPKITGFLYEITPLLKERFHNTKYSLEYIEDLEIENWEQISLNIMVDYNKENIDEIIEDVLTFELEINEKQKEYQLINKFMMDVEPL